MRRSPLLSQLRVLMKWYSESEGVELCGAAIHMLADMRHICDRQRWNYAELDKSAYDLYLRELDYRRRP